MKQKDFVRLVAENVWLDYRKTKTIVNTIFRLVEEQLIKKDNVVISWFWRFDTKVILERNWVNPQTLEKLKIPELTRIKLIPSKKLKANLNKWVK